MLKTDSRQEAMDPSMNRSNERTDQEKKERRLRNGLLALIVVLVAGCVIFLYLFDKAIDSAREAPTPAEVCLTNGGSYTTYGGGAFSLRWSCEYPQGIVPAPNRVG